MSPDRSPKHTEFKSTKGGPTPVGKEYIRIINKYVARYGIPVPSVVIEGAWEKAGFYEEHPDLEKGLIFKKSDPLPLP